MNNWLPCILTCLGTLPLFIFSFYVLNENYKDNQKHKNEIEYLDDLHA